MLKKRTTIYISHETWQTFREICRREGITASEKIEEMIHRYNLLHSPGNPQQRLDRLLQRQKTYRAKPLCACGKLADYKALIGNSWIPLCSRCLKRKGNTVLGFKPLEKTHRFPSE
jgi:hypothetical protein